VRRRILEIASADPRVISGAEVGSLTQTTGDRWSDLDLTFGLADDAAGEEVLHDWTDRLRHELGAVHLFDLPYVTTTYRVFLFPGNLQVDLSVTPGAVARMGDKFTLLFGEAVTRVQAPPLLAREVFGLAVHHALRARFSIERGRMWAALYFVNELRDETLSLACLRRGLLAKYARGVDELPAELLERAAASVARSLDRRELLRALTLGIGLLLDQAGGFIEGAADLEPGLRELMSTSLA